MINFVFYFNEDQNIGTTVNMLSLTGQFFPFKFPKFSRKWTTHQNFCRENLLEMPLRSFLAVDMTPHTPPLRALRWDTGDEKTQIFCGKGPLSMHHKKSLLGKLDFYFLFTMFQKSI